MPFVSTLINQVNSNSYTDTLALQLGITRFVGEDTSAFLARIYQASAALKEPSARGINELLCSNLNLSNFPGIQITTNSLTAISVTPGIITVNTSSLNLFSVEDDTYLKWLMLSDVVANLNQLSDVTATLLCNDMPAFCIPTQVNSTLTVAEPITLKDLSYTVQNKGLVASSILWNVTPPGYVVDGDKVIFNSPLQAGTTITYQSVINPYKIVASDIGILSLADQNFISAATNSDNVLGYQIREALQEIMGIDRSYWKK